MPLGRPRLRRRRVFCTPGHQTRAKIVFSRPPRGTPQISRFAAFCTSTKWHVICVLMGQVAFPWPLGTLWFLFPRLGCAINTHIEAPKPQKFSAVFAHCDRGCHTAPANIATPRQAKGARLLSHYAPRFLGRTTCYFLLNLGMI